SLKGTYRAESACVARTFRENRYVSPGKARVLRHGPGSRDSDGARGESRAAARGLGGRYTRHEPREEARRERVAGPGRVHGLRPNCRYMRRRSSPGRDPGAVATCGDRHEAVALCERRRRGIRVLLPGEEGGFGGRRDQDVD